MYKLLFIVVLILVIFYLYHDEPIVCEVKKKIRPTPHIIRYKTELSDAKSEVNDCDVKNMNYDKYMSRKTLPSTADSVRNPNVEFNLDYGPSSKYKVDDVNDNNPVYNINNTYELKKPTHAVGYLRTMHTGYDSEVYNAEIKEKIKNKNSNLGGGINEFNNVAASEGVELSVEDKLNLSEVKPVGYEMTDNGYFGGSRLLKGEYGNVPVYMYDDYDDARTTQWRVPGYGLYLPNSKAYWKETNLPEEANKWASVKNTIYNYPYYPH